MDEAAAEADESAALADADDVEAQVLWRVAKSKCLAARGLLDDAERVAGEAVAKALTTDHLNLHGAAQLALAEVLHAAGRDLEAAAAAEAAREAYGAKANRVGDRRAREVLEKLRGSRAPGIGAR